MIKKIVWTAALALGALTLCCVPSYGDTIIDPQIYVCTGCTKPAGGDPNVIDPSSINVGFGGKHAAVAPLLIIVGVPNDGSSPTISLPSGISPAAAAIYYGLHFATSGTTAGVLEGTLTSSSGGNAYSVSGIVNSGGGSSENWTNWEGFDGSSVSGAGFNLFAYAIGFALNSGSGGNSPINIDFTGLGTGSFVIAYNCAQSGSKCTGGDIGSTPFTNAGAFTGGPPPPPPPPPPVPEPTTLTLLGTGLVGLVVRARRREA